MKTPKLLALLALVIIIGTASCSKTGCTDPSASNYDSKADESDGSCIYPCTITCYNGGTVTSNCGCDCPPGFTGAHCETQIIPDCEKYHTAKITFKNSSSYHYTYDIIWDGSKIATLSYQTVSTPFTVAAGPHTLKWKINGTSNYGCTSSNPNLWECASEIYECNY